MIRARSKQSNHIGMVYLGDDVDDNLMMRVICDDVDDIVGVGGPLIDQ